MSFDADQLRPLAERIISLLRPGMVVGLGSGRTMQTLLRPLARAVHEGLPITAVATSQETERQARQLGIPMTTLDHKPEVDLTLDGADEVEPGQLHLLKGLGGALLREKVVAAASRRLVIAVTADKLVDRLGQRGLLPVEVVPFALPLCQRRIRQLGLDAHLRSEGKQVFVTDNGNYILDCRIGPIPDPASVERALKAIPGVVETGLFLGMADLVLVLEGTAVRELLRPGARRTQTQEDGG